MNGTVRKWVVNKRVNARNPDGSQALDDNDLKNYSGKMVAQITPNQKVIMMPLDASSVIGSLAGLAQITGEAFGSSAPEAPAMKQARAKSSVPTT